MTDDKNLSKSDIQTLATRDGVVAFFASLGYRTDARQAQSTVAMGIAVDSLKKHIKHIERIAVHDDGAEPLDFYLVELTSVTVAARQGFARALRNRVGNYVLVLTDDYERLDFVLLQRSLPMFTRIPMMATKQVAVLPRVITVNRRDPTQVQLRVLRRFTYTEADADAQYDKLLSAYTVAEWSEPLFNNRALFSDYYLNERLPELREWQERPEGAYHRLRELLGGMRQPATSDENATTAQPIVDSALELLGFKSVPAKGANDPDYRLYDPDDPGKPVAVCLAYPWNRYLDGRDETRDLRTPDENPGARVVTVLESGEAPWAIVTNGKLWRLYSSKTHSRSTNYYEIDLDETLAMNDPNEAFRYFWLFFRLSAFLAREVHRAGTSVEMSFLDRLLEESESYAKGLGERLKDRVFERVFPHFAAGFIEYAKARPGLDLAAQLTAKEEPAEEFRRQVFNGTLTLLYRLLFLLYAESRDLLPVKEVRGYWEQSLTKLKEDIAEKAGAIMDEAPDRLRKAYGASAHATDLYDRLLGLFSVIDRGRRDLNVPLYNGGLFITKPDAGDHTQESETARFLAEYKIPDRYLALGLDLLARDLDDKRQDLVLVDYKSLGVRQLGSIYEGLLEFRVRVAPEKMAVVKGKKTEEVIPYEEAAKSKKKVLTVGRGGKSMERVYQPGEVYLENDRRERKASGSYYTPDHIVKYIVENTVGPVLADKFDKLRPEFRTIQKQYQDARKRDAEFRKRGQDRNESDKIVRSGDFRKLVDDLFDLKVLDPAMGSGHFLVEAVDFICDRILGQREGFLRAFPWNPLTRYLQDTREAIITEMERQGVTVDAGRLTDINLLKRYVLKRCVYGVDLNPMAVELAKVSLWLDCFTIGAPLSFLDHHLKDGNSLIGTRVQEVEAELAKQEEHNLSLFGGPFQGLLAATATIEELRRIPDATVEQAEQSRSLYASFERAQAPYKTALDIWVSQHFGNDRAQEYLTLAGGNLVEQICTGGEGLSKGSSDAIANARKIGTEKRFFHWDLEFPEAFVELDGGRWKSKHEQGFDAVVGNPPYVSAYSRHSQKDAMSDETYFFRTFGNQLGGRVNTYLVFLTATIHCLRCRGLWAMVLPDTIIHNESYAVTRHYLITQFNVREILKCTYPVFGDATVGSAVPVIQRYKAGAVRMVEARQASEVERKEFTTDTTLEVESILGAPSVRFPFATSEEIAFMSQLETSGVLLGDLCEIRDGVNPGPRAFRNVIIDPEGSPKPTWRRLLEGKNIDRYSISAPARTINYDPNLLTPDLKKKGASFREAWIFEPNKIVSRQTADRLIAAMDHSDAVGMNSVHFSRLKIGCHYSLWFVLACLNSRILNRYYRLRYQETRSTFPQVHISTLRKLPIPRIPDIPLTNELDSVTQEVNESILLNFPPAPRQLLDISTGLLPDIRQRVQHDLVSILAMNRSRQIESENNSSIEEAIELMICDLYGLEQW